MIIREPRELRIFLSGYYGQKNTGDDALAAVICWGLHKYLKPMYIDIASPPLVVPNGVPIRFLPQKLFPGHLRLVKSFRLMKSNLWVLGGGSILHDTLGLNLLQKMRRTISRYRKVARGKVIGLSLSLGPIRSQVAYRLLGDILDLMDFIAVRDEASWRLAAALGFTEKCLLSIDQAVLLPLINLPRVEVNLRKDDVPVVSVAPCDYHRFVNKTQAHLDVQRNQAIAQALADLARHTGISVRLIAFNGHPLYGDARAIEQIKKLLPSNKINVIAYCANPIYAFQQIQTSTCIIATRLHAAIFAFSAGVPFIVISYHPKVKEFAKYIGVPEKYVFDADALSADKLRASVEEILSTPQSFHTKMPLKLAQSLALDAFAKAAQTLGV
jgi:polysaccharide pyruvyl transferase WcaK-like protein